VLAAAMDRVRADLATRAPGTRSVILAHAFVTGEVGFAREPEPLTPWGHTSPRSAPNESDPQDHQP
ncbi:hypothetical protein ACWFQ4_30925, partial [Streptomyces koyangensis]